MAEWYLLNHPAPGARQDHAGTCCAGEKLFHKIGCAGCHVPDWHLLAAQPGGQGLHRSASTATAVSSSSGRLQRQDRPPGRQARLPGRRRSAIARLPKRGAYTIRGVYSDFKYHDVGADFYQVQFDGSIVKQWKTAPLWGVGTTAPYGHDGASLDLDSVIRRHGGEA